MVSSCLIKTLKLKRGTITHIHGYINWIFISSLHYSRHLFSSPRIVNCSTWQYLQCCCVSSRLLALMPLLQWVVMPNSLSVPPPPNPPPIAKPCSQPVPASNIWAHPTRSAGSSASPAMHCTREWVASHGPSACLLGLGMEEEGRTHTHTHTHTGLCVIRTTAAADHISPSFFPVD